MRGVLDRLPFRRLFRRAPHILIFDDYSPDRAIGAGVPRAVEMLRALAAAGARVTMWPLAGPMADNGYGIEPHGAAVVTPARLAPEADAVTARFHRLRRFLRRRGRSFDGIIVSRPHNMQVFRAAVMQPPAIVGLPPVLYDAEALYAERDILMHAVNGVPLAPDVARQMLDEELSLAVHAQTVLTVNEQSAEAFRTAGHHDVRWSAIRSLRGRPRPHSRRAMGSCLLVRPGSRASPTATPWSGLPITCCRSCGRDLVAMRR